MKTGVLFISGFIVLVLGIALVFRNWNAIVTVFHGVVPPLIAVIGLVIMFAATLKK